MLLAALLADWSLQRAGTEGAGECLSLHRGLRAQRSGQFADMGYSTEVIYGEARELRLGLQEKR